MFNTTAEAARRGWDFFRSADPPPSHDEVNERLRDEGLIGIAGRTYDHYRRLARHGYDGYLPINELDMAVKAKRRAS